MKKIKISDTIISGVNIVPVIGVTLVLLVILIVMSPVMNLPSLEVDLPEANTTETKDNNVTVSLGADGRVSVDTKVVDWPRLPAAIRSRLSKEAGETVVIVRADKTLPYGVVERLVKVVSANAGRRAVALATKQRTQQLAPAGGAQ